MATGFPQNLLHLTVHDLRNAINSIQLSLHVVEAGLPQGQDELEGDMAALKESVCQARQMVETLAMTCKLTSEKAPRHRLPVAPERLLEEVVAVVGTATGARSRITLQIRPSSPEEAELDMLLAQWALQQALRNVIAATPNGSITVISSGSEDIWEVAIVSSEPAGPTVVPGPIDPTVAVHLLGEARERRGLDLAIAGWISRRMQGSARLEVEPGAGSRVVLEWPLRPREASVETVGTPAKAATE